MKTLKNNISSNQNISGTLNSQKIILKTKLYKKRSRPNIINHLISIKYPHQIKFHKSKMKRSYQPRDIIAKSCFDYSTLLRRLRRIRRRKNAFKQIFLIRLELGVSPKSLQQAMIHFQTLDNSLLTQIIKRAAAFLIHQMGEDYSQAGSRTFNYGPKTLVNSMLSIKFCRINSTNL